MWRTFSKFGGLKKVAIYFSHKSVAHLCDGAALGPSAADHGGLHECLPSPGGWLRTGWPGRAVAGGLGSVLCDALSPSRLARARSRDRAGKRGGKGTGMWGS